LKGLNGTVEVSEWAWAPDDVGPGDLSEPRNAVEVSLNPLTWNISLPASPTMQRLRTGRERCKGRNVLLNCRPSFVPLMSPG